MYWELATKQQERDIYSKFNTNEESIKTDVEHLKIWLEKRPHLPNIKDENLLTNFLLSGKNSLENTKKHIEMYYVGKSMMPDLYANRDPTQPWFRSAMDKLISMPLPKLTPENYRIILARAFKNSSSTLPDATKFLKANLMIVDLLLQVEKRCGIVMIFDCKEVSALHTPILISESKRFVALTNGNLGISPKKIYLLNVHPVVEPCIALFKKLVKKKLVERITVWNKKPTDLIEVLPKEVLPADYGGSLPSSTELKNQLCDYACECRDWFSSDELVKADLTKKPKDCLVNPDAQFLCGVDGSFRKLCID